MILALFVAGFLPACDADEDIGAGEDARAFEDGVSADTAGGAFRVVLLSREGLDVGDNTLIARVGFHDPGDPEGPGTGIPGALVHLDAYMPNGAGHIEGIEAIYLDDGRYRLSGIELDEPGVWRFELGIELGATMDESVGFSFEIADASS